MNSGSFLVCSTGPSTNQLLTLVGLPLTLLALGGEPSLYHSGGSLYQPSEKALSGPSFQCFLTESSNTGPSSTLRGITLPALPIPT